MPAGEASAAEEPEATGLTVARTSVATRLAASVVGVAVASLAVATIVGVTTGEDLADDLNDERLTATVESAAFDVAAEFRALERTTNTLAVSRQAPTAITAFDTAIDELANEVDLDRLDDELDELVTEYRRRYLEPLQESGQDAQLRDLVANDRVSLFLQYEYAVDLGPVTNPSVIDDADDGSTWTEVHRTVHPTYRDVVSRLGYLDLYLVAADGTIVYTVSKRPDIGTNLETGPFSGSVLSDVFVELKDQPDEGAVVSDLEFYDPWPGTPVGVAGSPVLDGSRFAGALMVSYDGSELTSLLTGDGRYEAAGLPEDGDVYVIGAGGLLRTDPRTYVEDPEAHLDASQASGNLGESQRERIESVGTTALTQRASDETREATRDGAAGVASRTSMTGVSVVNTSLPVDVEGVQWSVVAEMDASTAGNRLDDFQQLLIVGAAIFVVIVAFLAVAWANGIVRPIRLISDRIGRGSGREEPIEVPPQSPVEIQLLASQLGVMRHTLFEQQKQVAEARHNRLELLRSMLPPSVAERLSSGDSQSLEQAPAASVVVVVVLGLADLVRADSDHVDRELVDHLHAELDDAATQHGLDRIKVVGDAYFAVCGHDRQYIDHAPRAVGFAREALAAVRAADSPIPLDVAVGIHSGPVTTGTAGGARLVYDVWGETVARAHQIARQADAGEIRLSETSRVLLPDSIGTATVEDGIARIAPEGASR